MSDLELSRFHCINISGWDLPPWPARRVLWWNTVHYIRHLPVCGAGLGVPDTTVLYGYTHHDRAARQSLVEGFVVGRHTAHYPGESAPSGFFTGFPRFLEN